MPLGVREDRITAGQKLCNTHEGECSVTRHCGGGGVMSRINTLMELDDSSVCGIASSIR